MSRLIVVLIACCSLTMLADAPVALAQREPGLAAVARYYQRVNDCWQRYDAHKIASFAKAVDCADHDVIAEFEVARYPYMDMARWMVAQHAVIAERVERHQLTPTEGRAAWAEVEMRLGGEMQNRNAAGGQNRAVEARPRPPQGDRQAMLQRLLQQDEIFRAQIGPPPPIEPFYPDPFLWMGESPYSGAAEPLPYPKQLVCYPAGKTEICDFY